MIDRLIQLINLPETFVGEAPVGIPNCQWILQTAGSSTLHFDKRNYDKPTFSIYVRDQNNEQALARVNLIFKNIRNTTDGQSAIIVTRLPSFVGRDDSLRTIYVFQIQYQTGGY